MTIVNLKNQKTGVIKQVKIGPSWTALFFGLFVPLFRADWKFFVIFAIFDILAAFSWGLSAIIFDIIACIKYNDWYITELLSSGYLPDDEQSKQALKQRKLYFKD